MILTLYQFHRTPTIPAKDEHGRAYWYRVEDRAYSNADEWGDHVSTSYAIAVLCLPLLKETPKGVWLDLGWNDKRFVLHRSRKRYADSTFEAALRSYQQRKLREISIYEARIHAAQRYHDMAAAHLPKDPSDAVTTARPILLQDLP